MSEEVKLKRVRRKEDTVTAFLFREDGECEKTEIDLDEALFELAESDKRRQKPR